MESATILMPLAPAYAVFCFPSEPNIPERPEYEKNINTLSMYGEKFYQLNAAWKVQQLSRPLAPDKAVFKESELMFRVT